MIRPTENLKEAWNSMGATNNTERSARMLINSQQETENGGASDEST